MTGRAAITTARRITEGASLALLALLAVSFTLRRSATAFLTVLPPWFWAAPGILLVLASRVRGSRHRTRLLLAP